MKNTIPQVALELVQTFVKRIWESFLESVKTSALANEANRGCSQINKRYQKLYEN